MARIRSGVACVAVCWLLAAMASAQELAVPSELASSSLLIGVARAGERLVAVGDWGHIVLSDDDGRTWRQARTVPSQRTLTAVTFADAERGWAVGHDALVLHTADGGETWTRQFSAPEDDAPLLSVWFEDARRGLAVGAFGLALETRDGGESWRRVHLIEVGEDDEQPHLNAVFPGPTGSLFVAAEFGTVLRLRAGAENWERLAPPYQGSFWGGLDLGAGAVLVFGMRGHAFRSEDLGESWHAVATDTDQSIQAARRLADASVAMVGLGGVVLTSQDGGRSFQAVVEPDRKGIADVIEGRSGDLLLFGEAGIRTRPRPEPHR